MAKILYGVAGEGFGHSSRSELFGQRLIEAGHEVMFAASRKSHAYLEPLFGSRVWSVYGLRFYYRNGSVCPLRTLRDNLVGYRQGRRINRRLFSDHVRDFAPDLIISDFEPFTAWWAFRNRVPCLSIDHEHLLTLGDLDRIPGVSKERWMAKIVTRGYHTFADAYLVLNFFQTSLRGNSAMLPPVVRPCVAQVKPEYGDHIVLYCTDSGTAIRDKIVGCLNQFDNQSFLVYGFDQDHRFGNCIMKKTNSTGFVRDLAASRGVIATAGFSLISECLHFGKRMLLVPIKDQYEQIVNAYYIEKSGFGMRTESITRQAVAMFLDTLADPLPQCTAILKPDNEQAVKIIDSCAAAAGVPLNLIDKPVLSSVI